LTGLDYTIVSIPAFY